MNFAGEDPVAFRRRLLKRHPRHLGVLNLAAEKSGWGTPLPAWVGLWTAALGLLAFTYFPLIGDVGPGPKYVHNVVMLVIVLLVIALELPLSGRNVWSLASTTPGVRSR